MTLIPLLRGHNLHLTPLSKADVPTLAPWYLDAVFLRLLDSRPAMPKSEETLLQWVEGGQRGEETYRFGVRLAAGGDLIGFVELDGLMWSHQVSWLAIAIAPNWQGRGYGREALSLLLAFAFMELNLHRVQLTVFSYNLPAIALYEKAGFQREGTFREALHRDGRRHDMYLYGLLRHEWAGLNTP